MEGNSIRLRQRPRRYTSFPTPAVEVAPLIWQHAIIECIRKRIVPPHRELLSPGATFDHLSHPHLFAQTFVYPGRSKQTMAKRKAFRTRQFAMLNEGSPNDFYIGLIACQLISIRGSRLQNMQIFLG